MAELEMSLAIKIDIFVIASVCPGKKKDIERPSSFALSQALIELQQRGPPEGTCYAKVVIVKGNLKYIPTNWQQHKRGN